MSEMSDELGFWIIGLPFGIVVWAAALFMVGGLIVIFIDWLKHNGRH